MGFSMSSHPLTNFEIQKHYRMEPRFSGAYSRSNFPKKWSLYYFFWKCCCSTSWNSNCKFYFNFSLKTEIIKILLSITRNKKKNHDKIHVLAKSKLDSIETLVSQTLIDIRHEEFNAIITEKEKYKRMKENVRNVSEPSSAETQENMRLMV